MPHNMVDRDLIFGFACYRLESMAEGVEAHAMSMDCRRGISAVFFRVSRAFPVNRVEQFTKLLRNRIVGSLLRPQMAISG